MCDVGTLEALLMTAAGFIVAAIALIAVATALNGGFFSAPGAPVPMAAAGVATLAAIGALVAARVLADDYFACMGAPVACAGDYSNVVNSLDALITTLSIQAAATFALAAVAWIPWAVTPAQIAIVAALVAQAALIPSVVVFWSELQSCLRAAALAAVVPLLVSTGIIVIGGVWFALAVNRRKTKRPPGQ